MHDWQSQDAKNPFSEVVKKTRDEGPADRARDEGPADRARRPCPQTVIVHGQRAAVVVSALDFDAVVKPRMSFAQLLPCVPPGADPWPDDVVDAIDDRSSDKGRDIAF